MAVYIIPEILCLCQVFGNPDNVLHTNTLELRQNGYHFADGILKFIFSCKSCSILIKISQYNDSNDVINNNSVLVHIISWHRAIILISDGLGYSASMS